MVKFLSSLNQFVLIHCFVMMLLADFIRADTEADYVFKKVMTTGANSWIEQMLSLAFSLVSPLSSLVLLWREVEDESCLEFNINHRYLQYLNCNKLIVCQEK